ncbi:tRNA(Ile)-lysidine synthase TilS/MesJ [Pedobacter sp. UYP1]
MIANDVAKVRHLLGISGGKDSTALAIYMNVTLSKYRTV